MIRTGVCLILAGAVLSTTTGCHKSGSSNPVSPRDTGIVAYKPNIYIHPATRQEVRVQLSFPLGGELILSSPPYATGWDVTIDPDGTIDKTYQFLFYEARTPDAYQYSSGWAVARDSLNSFFVRTLGTAGFSQHEIADFLEYWIPRLQGSEYYRIFPQQNSQINKIITVDIAPRPSGFLRLFFVFQGTSGPPQPLVAPQLSTITRNGYFAVEWGGLMK